MVTAQSVFVTIVRDGDSFASTGGEIRLADVCAPEAGEPSYYVAKNHLEKFILQRTVTVYPVATGYYGRTIADVYVDGIHVNTRMRNLGFTC